jgi:hypothetical protein
MPNATIDDLKKSIDSLVSVQNRSNVVARDRFVQKEDPLSMLTEEVEESNDILNEILKNDKLTSKKMDDKFKFPKLAAAGAALTAAVASIGLLTSKIGEGMEAQKQADQAQKQFFDQIETSRKSDISRINKLLANNEINLQQANTAINAVEKISKIQTASAKVGEVKFKVLGKEIDNTFLKGFSGVIKQIANITTGGEIKRNEEISRKMIQQNLKINQQILKSATTKKQVIKAPISSTDSNVLKFKGLSESVGKEFNIPPEVLLGLIKQESGGIHTKGPLLSSGAHKGTRAQGITQIMPKTQKAIESKTGRTFDLMQSEDAIWAAGWLLNDAAKRYKQKYNLDDSEAMKYAIVDYHSGFKGVEKYRAGKTTIDLATNLPTRNYVKNILDSADAFRNLAFSKAGNNVSPIADTIKANIVKKNANDREIENKKLLDEVKKLPGNIASEMKKIQQKQNTPNITMSTNSYGE